MDSRIFSTHICRKLTLDGFTVKNNLRLSVAQRLLRRLCPACSLVVDGGMHAINPTGCLDCQKGVVGRIAIIEYLEREHIMQMDQGDWVMPTTLKKECEELAKKGIVDTTEMAFMD